MVICISCARAIANDREDDDCTVVWAAFHPGSNSQNAAVPPYDPFSRTSAYPV